jgi:co-chaperonin GroES (HSP10)
MMQPMPGKIIVIQDGSQEKRGGIMVSQRFAQKDRPMTGRVLAVGVGKPCELDDGEIMRRCKIAIANGKDGLFTEMVNIVKEERQSRPVSVKAGDRVVFKVFAGDGIEWTDGSMCRCVTEEDILARIEE